MKLNIAKDNTTERRGCLVRLVVKVFVLAKKTARGAGPVDCNVTVVFIVNEYLHASDSMASRINHRIQPYINYQYEHLSITNNYQTMG